MESSTASLPSSIPHPPLRVYARLRPLTPHELNRRRRTVVSCRDHRIVADDADGGLLPAEEDDSTTFTTVWNESTTQHQVYESLNTNGTTNSRSSSSSSSSSSNTMTTSQVLLQGHHCAVIAYGASGTGKSYTLWGTRQRASHTLNETSENDNNETQATNDETKNDNETEWGVAQRLISDVFDGLAESTVDDPVDDDHVDAADDSQPQPQSLPPPTRWQRVEYTIRLSVVEVYLERWRDLLAPTTSSTLVTLHPAIPHSTAKSGCGVTIANATRVSCVSATDALSILHRARARQTHTAGTTTNGTRTTHVALRSTLVVQVQVEQTLRPCPTGSLVSCDDWIRRTSRLHLIDLVSSSNGAESNDNVNDTDTAPVAASLVHFHHQVRALVQKWHNRAHTSGSCTDSCTDSTPWLAPGSDPTWPAVTRLLLSALTGPCRAVTTLIVCVSPSHAHGTETRRTLAVAHDLCRLQNHSHTVSTPRHDVPYTPALEASHRHQAQQWRHDRLERLVYALATECQRLRDRQPWDRTVWPVIEAIQATHPSVDEAGTDGTLRRRPLDFSIETKDEHDAKLERMRHYAKHKKCVQERDEAVAQCAHVTSDLAAASATVASLTAHHAQVQAACAALQRDHATQQQRLRHVEHLLRTSQFRESEAIVFLRQFRRFYYRLLKKTATEGSGEYRDFGSSVAGAPDLHQLVDIDHFMQQSGLLEGRDVGGDVSLDCRPTPEAMQLSMHHAEAQARQAHDDAVQAQALAPLPPLDSNHTTRQPTLHPDALIHVIPSEPVPPTSIVTRTESVHATQARQMVYQTPAGKCVTLREQMLQEELLQLSELNSQLRTRLDEERTNVEALTEQHGVVGAFDKMRAGQETRLLKEKLKRKDHDLHAVIWKMNELHMVGQTLASESKNREQHVGYLEESLQALRQQHERAVTEQHADERRWRNEVDSLRHQVEALAVPAWQEADQALSRMPVSCRMVVPFSSPMDVHVTDDADIENDNVSTHEPGEWMDYDFYPTNNQSQCAMATQTDALVGTSMSTQTDDDGWVDRSKLISVAVQTEDDDFFLHMSQGITTDTLGDYMFMDSPVKTSQPKVKLNDSIMFDNPTDAYPSYLDYQSGGTDDITLNGTVSTQLVDVIVPTPSMPAAIATSTGVSVTNRASTTECPISLPSTVISQPVEIPSPIATHNEPLEATQATRVDTAVGTDLSAAGSLHSTNSHSNEKVLFAGNTTDGSNEIHPSDDASNNDSQRQSRTTSASFGVGKAATKTDGPPLSSFLTRLQKQGQKKLERANDDDDKSTTPEFMKLFKKIGGRNQNESVLEASGAAPARDSTRTAFGQIKQGTLNTPSTDSHATPFKKWTPKKKKADDDSVDSDDSFAKQFMRGAQMGGAKSKAQNDDSDGSKSDPEKEAGGQTSTEAENGNEKSQVDDDDSSNSDSPAKVPIPTQSASPPVRRNDASDSDSSDDEKMPPPKPVVKPSVAAATPFRRKDDSDSDSDSSSDKRPPVKPIAKPTPPTPVATPPAVTPRRKDDSDSDSSDDDKRPPTKPITKPAPPAPTPVAAATPVRRKDDSDSDSSDDEKAPPPKPIVKPPTPAAPVMVTPACRKDDSDSDSSDDEKRPTKPVAKPPAPPAAIPSAVASTRMVRKVDSDSDSSDDDKKKVPPRTPVAAPAPATSPPVTKPLPKKRDDSSDSDSDSDSSAERRKARAKAATPVKPPTPTIPAPKPVPAPVSRSARQDDSDSDSDSSEDRRKARAVAAKPVAPKPAAAAPKPVAPPVKRKDDSSDSDSSDEPRKKVTPAPKVVPPPRRKDDSDSDDSDSSDDRRTRAKPAPVAAKPPAKSTKDDSSDSSSDDERTRKTGLSSTRDCNKSEIIDLTHRTDGLQFAGGKAADATPKTKVPDVASKVVSGLSPKSKPKKEVKKESKSSKSPSKSPSEKKAKFVVKDGKLVKSDGAETKTKTSSEKSKVKSKTSRASDDLDMTQKKVSSKKSVKPKKTKEAL